ncbi:MAG TPA: ABC transporter permease [Gemmatimonadaceae bacterium]|nr:ABC transporter permease [Gemmatimonadaceae bacterium]
MPGTRLVPPSWRRHLRVWGRSVDDDVDAELAFHLEMRVAEYVARGLAPDEARRRAQARFGELRPVRAECVDIGHRRRKTMRRAELVGTLRQDLRYAARTLRRQKLPAAVMVLCLALGIGGATTVFSVADTMLLRPLPFPNGDRIVTVGSQRVGRDPRPGVSSLPDIADWRARQRVFVDLGGIRPADFTLLLDGGRRPLRVRGARVTAGAFRALGVRPEAGRAFAESEDRPGAPRVVVVSRTLADRELGGAAGVLGRAVQLNGEPYAVVGVLPDEWRYPESAELWVPLALDPAREGRGSRFLWTLAALAPGVTLERARREMAAIGDALAREHPNDDVGYTVGVEPMRERYVGAARPAFVLMGAAAVLLFLVAGSNVVTLQLARAAGRSREVAVRSAIGASRGRLVAQLLTESVMLALAGGALGSGLAVLGSRLLARSVAGDLPPWMTFDVDLRVLAFTLAVSAAAGIAFGLVPALRLSRAGGETAARALRDGGRGGLDLTRGRLYRGLVIAQVALSLVLLTGAALAVQSFRRLQRVDPGFDPRGVMTFRVTLQGPRYDASPARAGVIAAITEGARALPGVVAAGATTHIPINGCCSQFGFNVEGQPDDAAHRAMATGSLVTPGFFRAMGIPLLRGRDFTAADGRDAPRVTVVSESFAARFWPNADALGKRLHLGYDWWTVVGVVRDVKQGTLADAPEPQFYRPHAQDPWEDMTVAVRVPPSRDPASLAAELRAAVRAADPSLPAFGFTTMPERMARAVAAQRLYGLLFAAFAAVSLALATAGVYGVMAYYVSRRTGEIGIRMALGADRARVLALVLRQGAAVAAAGVALGLAASVLAARGLAGVLYGVRTSEPLTCAAVAVVLGVTVLAAAYGPARRASAIEPMRALRAE